MYRWCAWMGAWSTSGLFTGLCGAPSRIFLKKSRIKTFFSERELKQDWELRQPETMNKSGYGILDLLDLNFHYHLYLFFNGETIMNGRWILHGKCKANKFLFRRPFHLRCAFICVNNNGVIKRVRVLTKIGQIEIPIPCRGKSFREDKSISTSAWNK